MPDRHLVWLHNLRGRFDVLVLAREVHPEEKPAHLCAGLALFELVLAEAFRMPHAATGSDLEERTFLEPRPLHGAARTSAVTGARAARDRIPEVVEPAVGVPGVLIGLLGTDLDRCLVDQDVGV